MGFGSLFSSNKQPAANPSPATQSDETNTQPVANSDDISKAFSDSLSSIEDSPVQVSPSSAQDDQDNTSESNHPAPFTDIAPTSNNYSGVSSVLNTQEDADAVMPTNSKEGESSLLDQTIKEIDQKEEEEANDSKENLSQEQISNYFANAQAAAPAPAPQDAPLDTPEQTPVETAPEPEITPAEANTAPEVETAPETETPVASPIIEKEETTNTIDIEDNAEDSPKDNVNNAPEEAGQPEENHLKESVSLPKDVINQVESILNASIQKKQQEIDAMRDKITAEENAVQKNEENLQKMRESLDQAKGKLIEEEASLSVEIDKLNALKEKVDDAIKNLEER